MLVSMFGAAALAIWASGNECSKDMCTWGGSSSCPTPSLLVSSKRSADVESHGVQNVYFWNAAPHAAEILYVDNEGREVSHGLISSGLRRMLVTSHDDVWRVRAVRPGHPGDQRLLLEHRVGVVQLKDCNCQQPQFVSVRRHSFYAVIRKK